MLENTFLHIPGVKEQTERSLWDAGFATWLDVLGSEQTPSFGQTDRKVAVAHLEKSVLALGNLEHQFFRDGLANKNAWRAFPHFLESIAYVDIETDGGTAGNAVTIIGLYDGKEFKAFVKGDNLESFRDEMSKYSMIVTFFGLGFDVPMIKKRFRGILLDQIHLDLCPTLRTVGLKGGLKSIEKQLGLQRGDTDGFTGLDAIRLWRQYRLGHDQKILATLLDYNREDVVNLEVLANHAYQVLRIQTLAAGKPELPKT